MSGAVRNNAADNLFAQQRQIANQVQHFVADKFIFIAQRTVLDSGGRQHNHVVF